MSYDLGGFSISSSTVQTIMIIFAVYSIVIIGFGAYVRYKSSKSEEGGLASFLTGGGGLGPFSIAMIAATNSMAGGTMLAAPGLTYKIGFAGGIVYYPGFLTAAFGLGSLGRKVAILRDRTKAVSILQLYRLRFNSKLFITSMALTGAVFLMFFGVGQITSGAKAFAAATGTGNYTLGLILTVAITVVYTLSGGVKSLAKIAVVQGIFMLASVFTILGVLIVTNTADYGSLENAMKFVAESQPIMVSADAWGFGLSLGLALFAGVGLGTLPHALSVSMTYNNHGKLKRGVIISCIVFTICQGIMCQIGPLVYAQNPNIATADYTTLFVATNLLPSWLGGVIFCGMFAAIQSSIAGVCMAGAAHISKDFIVDCIRPNTSDKAAAKINSAALLGIALVAVIISLNPAELTQYMINFSIGALSSAWYVPILFGMYWKKATKVGASLSVILGTFTYISLYLVSVMPETKAFWMSAFGGMNPFLISIIVSILGMVIGSLASQDKKSPLGVHQVFFCKDYDEKFADLEYVKAL